MSAPGKGKQTTSTLLDKPFDDDDNAYSSGATPWRTCCLVFTTLIVAGLAGLFGYVAFKGQTTPCPNANISIGLYTEAISLAPLILGFILMALSTDGNDARVGGKTGAVFACCVCFTIVGFVGGAVITSIEKHKTGCDLLKDGAPCNTKCPHLWIGVKVWFGLLVGIASLIILMIGLAVYRDRRSNNTSQLTTLDGTFEVENEDENDMTFGKGLKKISGRAKDAPSVSF